MKTLETLSATDLAELDLPPIRYCVATIVPQGLCVIAGAPKVGKSWLALDLCVHVANGESMWGLPVEQGTTLYLALEDTLPRLQSRLLRISDTIPSDMYIATSASTIAGDLIAQIDEFISVHTNTKLVVIDTLQIVRTQNKDISYAADYSDVRAIKDVADKHGITIVVVHHIRKQDADDPLERISGTNGIGGAADAAMILTKNRRRDKSATLMLTGRDIEDTEIPLMLDECCRWQREDNAADAPKNDVPDEINALCDYIAGAGRYKGKNSALADIISGIVEYEVSAQGLKSKMTKWGSTLSKRGVSYRDYSSNGTRYVEVWLSQQTAISAASDSSDGDIVGDTSPEETPF